MESILKVATQEKAPWIADFVVKVGIPMTAFVGITIWALWRVDGNIMAVRDDMSHHLNDTSYVIKQNEEIKNLMRMQNSLSLQICINTSRGNTGVCFKER